MARDKIIKDIFKKTDPIKTSDPEERAKEQTQKDLEDLRLTNAEGGESYFIEARRAEEKAENLKREEFVGYLSSLKGPIEYKEKLVEYANLSVGYAGLEPGWHLAFFPTAPGTGTINIGKRSFDPEYGFFALLISPKKKEYIRAVKLLMSPVIDMNAVHVVITQAENTMDYERGFLLNGEAKVPGLIL